MKTKKKTVNYRRMLINSIKRKHFKLYLGLVVSFVSVSFLLKYVKFTPGDIPEVKGQKTVISAPTPTPLDILTTYVVQPGDTLSIISQKFYGDLFRWDKIVKANKLSSVEKIEVGSVLIIPR